MLFTAIVTSAYTLDSRSKQKLQNKYTHAATKPSPIYQHISRLRSLASECSSVIEIGLWEMDSSWGILQGLSENPSSIRSYHGIDPRRPSAHTLNLAQTLAEAQGIAFQFSQINDMEINDLEPAEMLFIDSLHTYCHLTYELEMFSPKISKYIAMHDTSAPWGEQDDGEYQGDYSEYPKNIDRSKRGLWLAVEDFLSHHPEWSLLERHFHCHGLTILKRVTD